MEDIQKIKIDTDELIDAFGLQIGIDCAILEKWLSSTFLLSETMTSALEKLRVRIHKEDSAWNEEELKMRFLAFLFDYADLEVFKKLMIINNPFMGHFCKGVFGNLRPCMIKIIV
jgi:hypothetical protein